jgi:phosphate-selective porin OprO and OprP
MGCGVYRKILWALAAVAVWGCSAVAWGQEGPLPPAAAPSAGSGQSQPGNTPMTFDDIRARLEQQDMQIRQLQAQLAQQQGTPVTATAYANPPAAAAAPATPTDPRLPPGATVVGSNLSGVVFFKDGEFLNFSTPNKDFTMHLGGWVQWDNAWWNEPAALRVAQTPKAGNQNAILASQNAGGGMNNGTFGSLEDGEYWRRLRIVQEGTFWETGEYRFNWALENVQFSTCGLDEMWVGQNSLPLVGTIRVGHVKNAIGLEADMSSSSRAMTFMERSSYSEAIELSQNFVTGLWFGNSYADDRVTYQATLFRPDNGSSGDFFGNGQSGVQGRLTSLPLYEDEGRHLLHFGLSGGWRDGTANLANANYIGNTITLSARPELRDDDPAAGQAINNANSNRMISTGALACDSEYLMGLESLYIRGPFSFQAEYGWNWLNNASGILSTSTPAHPALTAPADYMFNGGYVQVAYTLTGEHRAYDKKSGTFSRYYFGTQGPYERGFLVRDENGCLCWGRGAWEVAARYTYVDLNSGVDGTRVQGGVMEGFGVALNWYANTNLTVNTEWIWDNRYDQPTAQPTTPGTVASIPGAVSAVGVRVQYSF